MSEENTTALQSDAEVAAENAGPDAVAAAQAATAQALSAQHIATQAVSGAAPIQPVAPAANDHARVSAGILKKAEEELAHYLPGKLDVAFMPDLNLTLTPSVKQGEASLHMHFKGPEVQADPIAFKNNLEAVLSLHPAFAHVLAQPAHKLDAHSSADGGVDITVPKLVEHQYQKLVKALADTPAASVTPLAEAPKVADHKPHAATAVMPKAEHKPEHTPQAMQSHHQDEHAAAATHAMSPGSIDEPKIGLGGTGLKPNPILEPKIGYNNSVAEDKPAHDSHHAAHPQASHEAPANTVANDNEARAEHHGKGVAASQAVAASRA